MLFLCLIVICLYLNEFTLAFTPSNTVLGHSAVFAYSRIYITGGFLPKNKLGFDGTASSEFYYLNVSQPFRVGAEDKLPWVDLSSPQVPEHAWSAFSNCGLDNSLFLYTGDNAVTVYAYINLQKWNNFGTTNPPQYAFHSQSQTVCDVRTGKMYRFSGINTSQPNNKTNNYMDILNTSTLAWEHVINDQEGRYDHTGTLLPNGFIVYIGGRRADDSYVDMSELLLYNTNNDTWTLMSATGSPTPRAYHSAVLTQDGRIIVYGGYTGSSFSIVSDDLVILDTSDYTWSNANVTGSPPPSRYFHTATLVGYYMIVAFGRTNNDLPPPTSNEVFILNTYDKSNYKWVNEFNPDLQDLPDLPDQNLYKNLSTQNRNLTIGIIILSIVLALIGASFLIYFYRKRLLSRPDILVPSSQEVQAL